MATDRVADKWSKLGPDYTNLFLGSPIFREYQIRLAFGEAYVARYRDRPAWPVDLLADEYFPALQPKRVLSLCCGFGGLEQYLLPRMTSGATCLGVDVAAGAIDVARQRAADAGLAGRLEYRVCDLNTWNFPVGEFDLVLAGGALHHLADLERVADGIWHSLRPGGLLYANECVGPNWMDHSPRQLELINAVAYLLPYRLRWRRATPFRHRYARLNRVTEGVLNTWRRLRTLPDPALHPEWSRPKRIFARALRWLPGIGRRTPDDYFSFGRLHDSLKAHLLRSDPSECVRSADVVPIFRQRFPGLEVRPYGGPLLVNAPDRQFFLNFDASSKSDRALASLLCQLEEHLMAAGEIGPEFAILIGRKT
jgi:SAM-dependent methyltransferase